MVSEVGTCIFIFLNYCVLCGKIYLAKTEHNLSYSIGL